LVSALDGADLDGADPDGDLATHGATAPGEILFTALGDFAMHTPWDSITDSTVVDYGTDLVL